MGRDFATGISGLEHRALVIAAIGERAARKGISREEAAREVLDQEYEWRRRALEARWLPGDAVAEVVAQAALAAGRLIRRAVRGTRRTRTDDQVPGGR